jgi:hypothetical protein
MLNFPKNRVTDNPRNPTHFGKIRLPHRMFMVSIAPLLAMTVFQAGAQEANTRAGYHYGVQATFSTPFGNRDPIANGAGFSVYGEKIWNSDIGLRGRLEYMAHKTATFSTHRSFPPFGEMETKEKLSYTTAIVDCLLYNDTKYIPYVLVGIGFGNEKRQVLPGYEASGVSSPENLAYGTLYTGFGWHLTKHVGLEIRNRWIGENTFEVSLCLFK